jgi:hypothetical protein
MVDHCRNTATAVPVGATTAMRRARACTCAPCVQLRIIALPSSRAALRPGNLLVLDCVHG